MKKRKKEVVPLVLPLYIVIGIKIIIIIVVVVIIKIHHQQTQHLENNINQNIYNYNQINTPVSSKHNNEDVKIIDNNIVVNNMRIVPQSSSGNLDIINMANKEMNMKDKNINGDGEDKAQRNYYSDTKYDYDNTFVKPMNKLNENNLPSKKKFKVDNEMNLTNNPSFKIIYSKKYSIGKSSKFKNTTIPMCPQPNNIYPMNPKVKEEMIINNKNENHSYQPPYTLPYTTMTTTVITAPSPSNPLKALDKNSALITPVPIPQAIPNRKVNNVLLNPNLVPLPEEISNDNGQQNLSTNHFHSSNQSIKEKSCPLNSTKIQLYMTSIQSI